MTPPPNAAKPSYSYGSGDRCRYGPYTLRAVGVGRRDEVAEVPGIVEALRRLEAAWAEAEQEWLAEWRAARARIGVSGCGSTILSEDAAA
jgi:hypothetical protein